MWVGGQAVDDTHTHTPFCNDLGLQQGHFSMVCRFSCPCSCHSRLRSYSPSLLSMSTAPGQVRGSAFNSLGSILKWCPRVQKGDISLVVQLRRGHQGCWEQDRDSDVVGLVEPTVVPWVSSGADTVLASERLASMCPRFMVYMAC